MTFLAYAQFDMQNMSRLWAYGAFLLAALIVGYLAWSYAITPFRQELRPSAPVAQPVTGEVPVVNPTLDDDKDLAAFSDHRPLPAFTTKHIPVRITEVVHLRGNPDARITLVEHSSFSNPYSSIMHAGLKELISENSQVNWVFRHHPLSYEQFDYPAAFASECIYNQLGNTGFWQFLDLTSPKKITRMEDIRKFALQTGVNPKLYDSCIENDQTDKRVRLQKLENQTFVKPAALPTFLFVDNISGTVRYMEGAATQDYVRKVVEDMLKR